MNAKKDDTQSNPSQRPEHGSGDRNGQAYVTPGGGPKKKGVDERYGADYSESQGGSVGAPPPGSKTKP